MDNEPTLIFLHLPKTGGTSVTHMLRAVLQPAMLVQDAADVRAFLDLPTEQRKRLRLVAGHMPHGIDRWIERPCRYVTWLRDPIDRVISAYFHVKRVADHPRHRQVNDGLSLADFAKETNYNSQTSRLGRYEFLEILTRPAYWWRGVPIGAAAFDTAAETLRRCCFAGLQEHMEEDMRQLFDRLGVAQPFAVPRLLAADNRPPLSEIDPQEIEVIREHNRFDIALYEYAKRLRGERLGVTRPPPNDG